MRQVPDTQEVLLSPDSEISYVVEILQRVEPDDLGKAAEQVDTLELFTFSANSSLFDRFHFDALAHDNSAASTKIQSVTVPSPPYPSSPPAQPIPTTLLGEQLVSKWNRTDLDRVQIFLAVYRVDRKGTDVVFSMNAPIVQRESTEEVLAARRKTFDAAVQSFRILDFGLFA